MKITLKAMRVNSNLTQSEVAKKAGISKSTLINWENNKTSPTAVQFCRLCEIYGCSTKDIFLPIELAKS